MKKKPVSDFNCLRFREYSLKDCKLSKAQAADVPVFHKRKKLKERTKEFVKQFKTAMKEHYNEPNYGRWIEC